MKTGRQLTDAQRERITRNFKAAKLIRERKRSLESRDSLSPLTFSPSACGGPPEAGRYSLDGAASYAADWGSPILKKTNNNLFTEGDFQRKAFTELNPNIGRGHFNARQQEEIRSIQRDLLDCASPAVASKGNNHADVENLQKYSSPDIFPTAARGSTFQSKENARAEGSREKSWQQEEIRSIQTDLLDCGTAVGPKGNNRADEEILHIYPPPSFYPTVVCGPTFQSKENARTEGTCDKSWITELPEIVDENLLKDIDALCEQRNRQRKMSEGNSIVALTIGGERVNEGHPAPSASFVVNQQCCPSGGKMSAIQTSRLHSSASDICNGNQILCVTSPGSENAVEVSLLGRSSVADPSLLSADSGLLDPAVLSLRGPDAGAEVADAANEQALPHLQKLNLSQREAATSDTKKPLLILAGPGSGKTSTMVARLLTLMHEGVQPANVLAMTFTTAAAMEMRERIASAVGKALSKELSITTFHSFCLQLCRLHPEKLGRTSEFLVFGRGQQRKAVIEATRMLTSEMPATAVDGEKPCSRSRSDNPTCWKDQARKWQQLITQAKCAGKTSKDYENCGNLPVAAVLRNYEKCLAACDALDYHDLISSAYKLLNENSEVLANCQKQWSCMLVDEFQDTSTMQYSFLRLLASHNRITVVGDDDQSIFGFNGANSTGFDSFRKDFPNHKEVRLHQNYRSTKCIVGAASALIKNNCKRCPSKQAFTDNSLGEKIEIRECRNESAQCALVADHIVMNEASSSTGSSYGSTAVLYRRQVTGKLFQLTFRARKIPFNLHGVAIYRKHAMKNIMALLWTVIPGSRDVFSRRVFKALYNADKEETKKVVEYVEKIAKGKRCDFLQSAEEIFSAKISGTFNRRQLALGKKVLAAIKTLTHVIHKEQSLSAVVTAAANLLPQRPVFDKRAVITEDGGKLLNEDEDPRTILEFLLDDVNQFLSTRYICDTKSETERGENGGSVIALRAFLDHLVARENENLKYRKQEDKNSVTLTTMHQSKGLEWDTVFIVKANDTETPLLHEGIGCADETSMSLEEERRLFYVAMTRARKKLFITHVVVDSKRQVLKPSRFLVELPRHFVSLQCETTQQSDRTSMSGKESMRDNRRTGVEDARSDGIDAGVPAKLLTDEDGERRSEWQNGEHPTSHSNLGASAFLKGFAVETRSVVALLFHTWAKKPCFQDPGRLLSKVGFVIDERLRSKSTKNRDVLIQLKCMLKEEAALSYAQNVLAWEKLPAEERSILQAERQEYFQHQNAERGLAAAAATPKQISFLRSLGCTVEPSSRLHASKLIEQYKHV